MNLNNQNRIEPSFLRSNDPRIVQLANALASLGWYLERREDEVASLTTSEKTAIEARIGHLLEGRVIKLKEGTQGYVASYLRQPELAKKNPKRMFLGAQDGGYFGRIFNNDLTAEKFVNTQRLAWRIDDFVRQFMTRKRRKERVADWKADYKALLGDKLVDEHGNLLDQVVPQSAVFLSAIIFEEWVVLQNQPIDGLIEELSKSDSTAFTALTEKLVLLIDFAKQDQNLSKSWPTLLKSQSFFENFASYLRGRIGAAA